MSTRRYFGTDGIRGIAGEHPMTGEFAFKLGVAAAEAFGRPATFVLGMDTRRSGPMLAHGLAAGLLARGSDVLWAGVMPTPGISFLARHLTAEAGVVVSASHNPFEDNGIKFFDAQGEKLPDALEQRIEEILEHRAAQQAVTGADVGSLRRYRYEEDHYAQFLLVNAPDLGGLRVGLDCANGASSEIAPRVFAQTGAQLDVIGNSPDGVNINSQCGSTYPQAIIDWVLARGLDVGVTFDGDADRTLLVDKRGRLVTGDHMLAILALTRGEKRIVGTIMSNLGVERYLQERGVDLVRTQVGDRYVFKSLVENGLTIGGEPSGHVIIRDMAPTGDGLLTALTTLSAVRASGRSLAAWMDEIPSYPQVIVNVSVPAAARGDAATSEQVRVALRQVEQDLGRDGRVNIRASGTEPVIRIMVEGKDRGAITDAANGLAAVVEQAASGSPQADFLPADGPQVSAADKAAN